MQKSHCIRRTNHDITRISHQLLFAVSIGSILLIHTSTIVQAQDYTCDASNDFCPTKLDGVCDSKLGNTVPSELNGMCENGDCRDCDLCKQFEFDCNGCLNTRGCYWCPGDGTCHNSPYPWGFVTLSSTCLLDADWVSATDDGDAFCSALDSNIDQFFSDPLFAAQNWVFEQINVLPVWKQDIFGTGIRVRINDDGIDPDGAEWSDRFDINSSCADYEPIGLDANHGASVASILGASGNNGECAVGVAPGVTFSSCNVFVPGQTFTAFDYAVDTFDISHNSLGVESCPKLRPDLGETNSDDNVRRRRRILQGDATCPFTVEDATPCAVGLCTFSGGLLAATSSADLELCEAAIVDHCGDYYAEDRLACLDFLDLIVVGGCDYNSAPSSFIRALREGVTNGRDGKGILYVFASGNFFESGDDVNFSPLTNSRLTITVGAVGRDELHASYSTPGAALLVSAPGGDGGSISNHVVATQGGGCNAKMTGTSFSAPVVSGVLALMLEVNPELSWRDAQGILVETSRAVDDESDGSRTTNGAGFTHSNLYGFGIVNANDAVEAAKTWDLYCPEQQKAVESGILNLTILDNATFAPVHSVEFQGPALEDFLVESVVVLLDVQHFSRGDLEIILTSPAGTVSVLHPGKRPENTLLTEGELWKLMTVRNWGESVVGSWQLSVSDIRAGDLSTCTDAPFRIMSPLGAQIDCTFLEANSFCFNGTLDEALLEGPNSELSDREFEGNTLEEACCSCGGGTDTLDFEDELKQWKLEVYGRQSECLDSNMTSTPSSQTILETAAPSQSPSKRPTSTKAQTKATPETRKAEVDKAERITTIAATVAAFILVGLCIFGILRSPSESNRFAKAPTRDDGASDFENASGLMT